MSLIKIQNYSVKIEEIGKQILQNANLEINAGEIVVLVGENGSGKSSFAMSLLGLQEYSRSGSVILNEVDTIDLAIDEIARQGLFVSFQSPPEFEGIDLQSFLITTHKAIHPNSELSSFKLRKKILENIKKVGLPENFLERSLNQGFSGGEKRKSEVLQMLMLEPKLSVLDEVDSGLDIKSTANIAQVIREEASKNRAFIVISHSIEFIKKLKPNRIIELRNKSFHECTIEDLNKLELDVPKQD